MTTQVELAQFTEQELTRLCSIRLGKRGHFHREEAKRLMFLAWLVFHGKVTEWPTSS